MSAEQLKRRMGERDLWDLIVNNDDISFKHILPRMSQTVNFVFCLYNLMINNTSFFHSSSSSSSEFYFVVLQHAYFLC